MESKKLDFVSWLIFVLAWDGLLPVVVVTSPMIIQLLLPNHRGLIELASVLLPTAAFVTRYIIGKKRIMSNYCPVAVQKVQFFVFVIGICDLVLLEGLLIIWHLMPKGAVMFGGDDPMVLVVLASVYFAAMVIAMYPGMHKDDGI